MFFLLLMCRLKLKFLYMFAAGFYTYSIFALVFWETRRSDFGVSMGHHITTVILIVLSYVCRYVCILYGWLCCGGKGSMFNLIFFLLSMLVDSLVLVLLFLHSMMRAMCFLKLGKCQNIAELKVLQAFRLFFSLCLGSFYVSYTILFGSFGAQGLFIQIISNACVSWMFWCKYIDLWFAAIKLLWRWTRKSIRSKDRFITTCSIHFCFACLFFIFSGGFWFTGCLWNKYRIEASLAKISDPVCIQNELCWIC